MECILPFGMLCLSAWRMMFVKMVFAVYNLYLMVDGCQGKQPPCL